MPCGRNAWRRDGIPMRVNRKLLYVGVFLVAIGGVLVSADLVVADASAIRDALQLWPLAIVAIGLGIALRRTPFGLGGGLIAAAVPGLVLGGAFALAPRVVEDCGARGTGSSVTTEQGVFDGPAQVHISTGCGTLVVTTEPGDAWRFEADNTTSRAPDVDATERSLTIDARGRMGWQRFGDSRDAWRLTLPTSTIDDLSVVVNAGEGRLSLPDAQIARLDVTTNAGLTTVDLSDARVTTLAGTVNAGLLSYRLPAADVSGSFEINAGGLELCVPSDLGLRVRQEGDVAEITVNGQEQTDTSWESPNYASATYKADLSLQVHFGNVEINPIGGCQ
jgi:hypothetical protein